MHRIDFGMICRKPCQGSAAAAQEHVIVPNRPERCATGLQGRSIQGMRTAGCQFGARDLQQCNDPWIAEVAWDDLMIVRLKSSER